MGAKRTRVAWQTAHCAALLLSMLAPPSAQAQAPTDPYTQTRVTSYTYSATGVLQTEMAEPDNIASCVLTTHAYDVFGNRTAATVANCAGVVPLRQQFTSRTGTTNYGASTMSPTVVVAGVSMTLPRGVFATSAANALGHVEQREYDPRFGAVTKVTDANGLVTTMIVDDWGRRTRQTGPDGNFVQWSYCYLSGRGIDLASNTGNCPGAVPPEAPADAVMYIHSEPRDSAWTRIGPYTKTYSDRQGRVLRTVTESFDGLGQNATQRGQMIVRDSVYSAQGSKVMETQPYYLSSGSSTTSGSQDAGVSLTQYDALGRPVTLYTADPNGQGGAQSFGGAAGTYANYGSRVAARTSYTYAAGLTTITNDRGQTRLEEKNALGLTVRITDATGAQLAHQHDAFGNLIATRDALQNTLTLQYDIRGRKTQMNDPDSGLWKYEYDALGQLVWQESPNQRTAGTATTLAYDKLGRMVSRNEPEGTGAWWYDNCRAGMQCGSRYTRAGTGDMRTNSLTYDSLGRLTNTLTTVTNGPSMASAQSWDASGRLDTKTYPTGVKVRYGYTTLGYLETLKLVTPASVNPLPATPGGSPGASTSLAANTVLWRAQVVNAWGRIEQQTLANGVTSVASFEGATGRSLALSAGPGSGSGANATVLNHSYAWDSLNNLLYKADHIGDAVAGAVTESFEYADGLSRLTRYTVSAPAVPTGSRSVTLQYNALGMLLGKSDVGVYAYPSAGSTRPHALQSLTATDGATTTTTNYLYDANGNLTSASGGKYRTIAYTSFNLPDSQSGINGAPNGAAGGTATYTWVHDESHARIKEVRTIAGGSMAGTRTTWYLHPDSAGGLGFESEVNSPTTPSAANPAATSNRHYLSVGGQSIGVLVSTGAFPVINAGPPPAITSITLAKVEYWHKDHLGSLSATSDHAGAVTARYAYDAFGKRRHSNGSYDAFGSIVIDWSAATNAGTDRGYTGHEHLDDIGLIHMNGRIFDPTLGLFLQPDNHIQAPDNLQNYHRYAYCLNNPLTCTDPTGFSWAANNLTRLKNGPFMSWVGTRLTRIFTVIRSGDVDGGMRMLIELDRQATRAAASGFSDTGEIDDLHIVAEHGAAEPDTLFGGWGEGKRSDGSRLAGFVGAGVVTLGPLAGWNDLRDVQPVLIAGNGEGAGDAVMILGRRVDAMRNDARLASITAAATSMWLIYGPTLTRYAVAAGGGALNAGLRLCRIPTAVCAAALLAGAGYGIYQAATSTDDAGGAGSPDQSENSKPQRPEGVPEDWREEPGKKSGNTKWVNPDNPHDYVRVKPDGTVTQVRDGKAYDANGNRVDTRSPGAHGITPGGFVFRP